MSEQSQEVSQELRYNDEALGMVKTFDDVLALFNSTDVVVSDIADFGNGFRVLDNKKHLVGVPFVILEWSFREGDYLRDGEKAEYVAALVMTKHGEKHVIVDGGTGICRQLRAIKTRRAEQGIKNPAHGLMVERGLTVSEYEHADEKGNVSPASTFYLSE